MLIVDDDQETREMYSTFLGASGFDPVSCDRGRDALDLALSAHPDVIVTDLRVPGDVDGAELVARLRVNARTKDIGAIILSGVAFGPDRDRAERSGCDAYLLKPCLPDTLASEIRRIVVKRLYESRRGRFLRATHDRAAPQGPSRRRKM